MCYRKASPEYNRAYVWIQMEALMKLAGEIIHATEE